MQELSLGGSLPQDEDGVLETVEEFLIEADSNDEHFYNLQELEHMEDELNK